MGILAIFRGALKTMAIVMLLSQPWRAAAAQPDTAKLPAQTDQPESAPADSGANEKPSIVYPQDVQADEVVDAAGRPLEGVLVDVWSWYPGNEAKTDKQGAFRIKVESDGSKVEVRFLKEGWSPHYIAQQPLGRKKFKVTLNNSTYLEGRAVGSDGKPVGGTRIVAKQGPQQGDGVMIGDVRTETTTDDQGRYRLYLFPDTYQIDVASEPQGVVRVSDVQAGPKSPHELNLQLKPGVRFQARVLDDDTHEPVAGCVLWDWREKSLVGKSNDKGEIVIANLLPGDQEFNVGFGEPRQHDAFTIYETAPYGRWWSPNAKHEHQQRHIEKGGWQRNFDDLTFEMSIDMAPVTIYVEKGVIVTGRVTDPDGNPVARATVAPARTGTGNSLTGDTRYSVETKEDGTYEVCLPSSGEVEYNLLAHDGAYSTWRKYAAAVSEPMRTEPGRRIEHLDFTLHRPATVKGKVTNKAGRPAAGVQVRAHAADKRGNRYYDPTTTTKADGTFELGFIRPGKHHIQAEPFWLNADDAPDPSTSLVELKEGETVDDIKLIGAKRN